MKNWKNEINIKRKNFSSGENPVSNLPGICDFTITICYNNGVTQLHT